MDRRLIEDQHIVARYLADQLSDAEREAFETYCREHPDMFREIEATARFKVGFARLGEAEGFDALLNARPRPGTFLMRHAAIIVAVGVGLVALGGALYTVKAPAIGATVADVSGRFHSALPVVGNFELIRTRESNEYDARVVLPATPAALHFRVLPDVEGKASYNATLSRGDESRGEIIASVAGLKPDAQRFVSFYVSSSHMVSGVYSLRVTPEDEPGSGRTPSFSIIVIEPRN